MAVFTYHSHKKIKPLTYKKKANKVLYSLLILTLYILPFLVYAQEDENQDEFYGAPPPPAAPIDDIIYPMMFLMLLLVYYFFFKSKSKV